MAGGPIGCFPPYLGTTGNLFPKFLTGSGGNASPTRMGIGVVASLGSDVTAQLTFPMPPVIPSGTLKLLVRALTTASSGAAKLTVSDGAAGAGFDPSAVLLHGEPQVTFTFTIANQFVDNKITLTTVPAPNDCLIVAATFNSSGWTLGSEALFLIWALWE